MIYIKEKAYSAFNRNIDNPSEKVIGYFKSDNAWITFDSTNTFLEMFVEAFEEEKDAIVWVSGFDNIFNTNVRAKWLFPNVIYVSGGHFIKIKIKDEDMYTTISRSKLINSINKYLSAVLKYIKGIYIKSMFFIREMLGL